MDLGLKGKKAIVTGGGRGIGKAIARELAGEGVNVVIIARSKEELNATAKEISGATGAKVIPLIADVTSREQVDSVVADAIKQLGGVDILVNSAADPGGRATGPIETLSDDELMQDFNIKYMGALRCARAVIPHMKKQKSGRIINISGGNARNAGNLSGGARNVSLVHFTKTLANQLGRDGITVNVVHPGTTRTERTPKLLAERAKKEGKTPEQIEAADFAANSSRGNALGRMVDASEIAHVAVFLASEKASSLTGTLLVANGGAGNAVYY